jgi:hypothetical protein
VKEFRRYTIHPKCHSARVKNYVQKLQSLARAEPLVISFKTDDDDVVFIQGIQ